MTPNTAPTFTVHPDTDSMANMLSGRIATLLAQSVTRDGSATFIVSGGATPRRLYTYLARQEAPWAQVTIALADERWVDPGSAESNEHLVREVLLTNRAAEARFMGLKTEDNRPETAVPACNRAAAALKRPFDIVLLGMGEDGHTASLFPGAPELAEALDPATGTTYMSLYPPGMAGAATIPRMTMTLAALLDSRLILLLIAGPAKRAVYETALSGSDMAAMPIRAILQQTVVPVQVHWAP